MLRPSAGDRTRCWGPGEKKYLNARNATVSGGREKAAWEKGLDENLLLGCASSDDTLWEGG